MTGTAGKRRKLSKHSADDDQVSKISNMALKHRQVSSLLPALFTNYISV